MIAELVDIESGVASLLGGILKDASPLFATVQAGAIADRKSALAKALDLQAPAVLFGFESREKAGAGELVPGDPRLLVYVVATNLRSGDGARVGDVDGVGAYALANETLFALDGAELEGGRCLRAVDDRVVLSNERTIVFEQRWRVERRAAGAASVPLFDGQAIVGADAVVSVQLGSTEARSIAFGFPGIDGEFRHALGAVSRVVRWVGQLRADKDGELTVIESGVELLIGGGGAGAVSGPGGQVVERCTPEAFNRRGLRYVHPLTGQVVQNFELDFVQLAG